MSEPMEGARPEPEPGPGAPAAVAEAPGTVPEPPSERSSEPARPADPVPLGVTRTPTGVAEVDAQLERLADADHLAASGHLEVYEDVHRGLRDALTALDRRPGPPAPPTPGA
ncbi:MULTISPECIES: hypothetical protein [unclassified Streptomyces]|uniref:Uncharacterized protein n=2 Tax=Streptomyces TaxID=1883 RepID=A0ABU2XWC1_9ACTN|nr:hypothetical protein [Streptomyces sp. DSM 41529]MDT0550218.1 hypothetical protein [Streptomyces sp. DSM 41529]